MNDGDLDIHFHDVTPAIEFACWIIVLFAPLLQTANGAAVSTDQFVIQVALFSVALTGCIGLRLYQLLRR